jgi:hypothetical protein
VASKLFAGAHAHNLWSDLRRANTEAAKKERVLQYLSVTFSDDPAAQALVSEMTLGAERTVANIPRGGAVGRGRADTQTETVIIEWEKDLSKTGDHARDQLAEYLVGNWRSGQDYRYVLITTDGIVWRRYAPDWKSFIATGALHITGEDLREVGKFELNADTASEFPFFLDEVLFASQVRPATLGGIQQDFGDTSVTFVNSVRILGQVADFESSSELAIAYAQWQRFLSLAYGEFDSSPTVFLVHTYLSVFAKLIAYAVVTGRGMRDEASVRAALDGTAFEALNIERFVEDDFFHWVHDDAHFGPLRPMFREIARRIGEYDLSKVDEDILKGVYQELIDLETRHSLGEYYTPDWLCEKIVDEVPLVATSRVLDPACGSGSFLRAAVARLRLQYPTLTAEQLASPSYSH